jgi:hypothetical protein
MQREILVEMLYPIYPDLNIDLGGTYPLFLIDTEI